MQNTQTEDSKVSKKTQQFLDEVSEISKRYQYSLEARLNFHPKGIVPSIVVVEITPPKKESVDDKIKKGKFKAKKK